MSVNSKECRCCKKSRATIFGRVHWATAKKTNDGGFEYSEPYVKEKAESENAMLKKLLNRFINGHEFLVQGCDEYMKNNNQVSMPVTVEVDFGGRL